MSYFDSKNEKSKRSFEGETLWDMHDMTKSTDIFIYSFFILYSNILPLQNTFKKKAGFLHQ